MNMGHKVTDLVIHMIYILGKEHYDGKGKLHLKNDVSVILKSLINIPSCIKSLVHNLMSDFAE